MLIYVDVNTLLTYYYYIETTNTKGNDMDNELSDWEEMAERDYDDSEQDFDNQGASEGDRYSLNDKRVPYDPNVITHKDLLKPTTR